MGDRRTRMWAWDSLMIAYEPRLYTDAAVREGAGTGQKVFRAEPQARALYDQMIEALRRPETLSYKSEYHVEAWGQELGHCTYTVWLKKPNQFRVEAVWLDGHKAGTLVGDGDSLWIFWPGDRPRFGTIDEEYETTRSRVYMKEATPLAKHSIGHKVGDLGIPMLFMSIIDPSAFHGYTDSLQPHFDGAMGMGTNKSGDEDCDVIEASFIKHQRSWYLWLSKKDHLPRKIEQIVWASHNLLTYEVWSDVVIDGDIPAEKFVWTPPEEWQEWKLPSPKKSLLKLGTPAPDFELSLADGKKAKLSDFRGKIVWLHTWRGSSPAIREEMRDLQKLHEKYSGKGLILLGFDCWDDRRAGLRFLRESGVTFPTILDSSEAAIRVYSGDYRGTGLPLNYVIDRQGRVVDGWLSSPVRNSPRYDEGHARVLAALKKAGLKTEGP